MSSAPSPSPPFDPDSTLGALLIGVLVSYVLFGTATNQLYVYNRRFPNDSVNVKALVACAWYKLATIIIPVMLIEHHRGFAIWLMFPGPGMNIPRSLGVSVMFNAMAAGCAQGFFSFRIYRLSKQLYIPLLSWSLSLVFLGTSTTAFLVGLRVPYPDMIIQWGWLLDATWAIAAANDLFISAALVFWLWRRRDDSRRVTALFDKIITWTIETGLVTSTAAILNLICFITMRNNFIWIAWYMITARLYSNSLLASLNSRATLRSMNEKQNYSSSGLLRYPNNLSSNLSNLSTPMPEITVQTEHSY